MYHPLMGQAGAFPLAGAAPFLAEVRWKDFFNEFLNLRVFWESLPYLLKGFVLTLKLAFVSEGFILLLGLLVSLLRISRVSVIRGIAIVYIDVIRGLPLLLQIFLIYYGLPYIGIDFGQFWSAVIALTVCYAAYEAEIFRAGIESIHKGQMEAARSLGMGYFMAMRHVVLPQAVRRVIPPLSNEFIALLKDTALVSVISLLDVLYRSREMMGRLANVTPLVGAALCYLLLTIPLIRMVQYMEKQLARGD
jgi:polar amino acid transport system permease protein